MGTILTSYGDAGYQHEGYPAQILDDGSVTSAHGDDTGARMVGQVIAACSCGWTGTTRYPTTAPIDVDAEELALQEWEHEHARPVLQRDQLAKWDRLRTVLGRLGRWQHDRLLDRSGPDRSAAERQELLDRILRVLTSATELAQELRDTRDGDADRRR